jgi:ABC-2 type transport system ATP-binding protein
MLIELRQAGRSFQGMWALRDLSEMLRAGNVYAVLGANGAGKSTLLRLLAGWLPLTAGRILLDGAPMRPTAIHLRRQVLLLDESSAGSQGRLTEPLREMCRAINDYRADREGIEDEVTKWFERLGVVPVYNSNAEQMSKGQAYKIAMIGLFVIAPSVWLLDEPFSAGLDAEGLQILEAEIRGHVARGGLVVFSSQWPDHARRLADRALVLNEGRLAWSAPPDEMPPNMLISEAPASLLAVLRGLGPVGMAR